MTKICVGIEPHARLMMSRLAHEVAVMWPLVAGEASPAVLLRGGSASRVRLVPSDVFRAALLARAVAVVLAHNHLRDSGPSKEDLQVTRRLVAAGALLGVPLAAHLVLEPSMTHELVSGCSTPPAKAWCVFRKRQLSTTAP